MIRSINKNGPVTSAPSHKTEPEFEPMLAAKEIAHILGISRRTFDRMRAAGKAPPADFREGKIARWSPATIRTWLKDRQAGR
jgi:predicted DNA-binding transcriptional regulator AlpA